jgi:hypothetical protein
MTRARKDWGDYSLLTTFWRVVHQKVDSNVTK